jgi:hypothetical protein
MQTYSTFRPTGFDTHLVIRGDESREGWLVLPTTRNRDSDCLTESNFHVALAQLGGESHDVEVHRFGHWANGWFEIIIVRPDSASHLTANGIERDLEEYLVLDENDFSEREHEAAKGT